MATMTDEQKTDEAASWKEWQTAWGNTESGAHAHGWENGYKAGEAAARADLAAEVSRLREALAWYADETNYDAVERHTEPPPMRRVGRNIVAVGPGPIFWASSNAEEDRGTRARAALG
jgi:hypothetical protein